MVDIRAGVVRDLADHLAGVVARLDAGALTRRERLMLEQLREDISGAIGMAMFEPQERAVYGAGWDKIIGFVCENARGKA